MARLRDERGVALITALLIGTALTLIASVASFTAIQQLRASADDSRGARALTYAEAGLQKFITDLKAGTWTINQIMSAGCNGSSSPLAEPTTTIGNGSYSAQLLVYTSAAPTPPGPIPVSPYSSASQVCTLRSTSAKVPQQYVINSTGVIGTGSRTIRDLVTIQGAGLPLGVFVRNINANGTGNFNGISLFVKGDAVGREKMGFTGTDLAYTEKDIYCDANNNEVNVTPTTACPAGFASANVPAAIHATGTIYAKANGKTVEFPPSPNCTANSGGTANQSVWDGAGTGTGNIPAGSCGQAVVPPTSKFTSADMTRITTRQELPALTSAEYSSLKAQAQSSGLYCNFTVTPNTCTRAGASVAASSTVSDLTGLPSNFVAYFDFPVGSTQSVKWNVAVSPCPTAAATIVARNGGITFRGGNIVYGAAIAPDSPGGIVDVAGNATIIGPVIANQIILRGSATFKLDACALANSPNGTLNVFSGHWSEVDR